MAKTVWKFAFSMRSMEIAISMPRGAEIVCINMQGSIPCLWATVQPDNSSITRRFFVVGTGNPLPEDGIYRGTWFDGSFVWHLFEKYTK